MDRSVRHKTLLQLKPLGCNQPSKVPPALYHALLEITYPTTIHASRHIAETSVARTFNQLLGGVAIMPINPKRNPQRKMRKRWD